ncbi:multiple sugar transport system ATP-binding protein [Rhizobium sp. BK196]|uniref:ABC transporter ATP-binding protein n=1 Tax=unclassified Rhizobium TaxID=2613769 RepID=UPI00162069E7|nr:MULTISPECIES: ABC transporter ATP-binding protein [unclassified Rhizobium]MBB3309663.1 multiple sugar transport system ATP-binding protein [Rhizobium sp. BK196]MBB3462987.1 multiple sugar transport system ATP-binding protein [Rhizobium sp. BK377]
MPRVSFEHIVKSFGAVTILNDLNLSVDDGDFLVLLGPSGCGKTTLLNLLAGLLEVSDGRIMIGERDVTDLDPRDRGLAMVFQSYALYPTKTVYGNLKFGLAASKLDRAEIERRITVTAKLLQIEPLLNRKPGQLSGGQRQRVAIGRALVKQAGVVLFDEPLSNLDAKLRTEMRLEIKKLHDTLKPTVVYVTHDQIEAMTMATRIAVMDGGVIQQFGTPDEIYGRPANLFVAGFIGAPAMNLRKARLTVNGSGIKAAFDTGDAIDLGDYAFSKRPESGAEVVVGLRPEHFVVAEQPIANPAARFELPLRQAERTGSDATAYLGFGEQLLALRVDPDRAAGFRPGQPVRAEFPRGKANVFNAETGLRV